VLITLLSILPIVLGFGVLIFVHELGHFLAAKWAGIRAEAFAVGMGPTALSYRRGIGLRPGSTVLEHRRRVRTWLAEQGRWALDERREPPVEQVIEAETALGLDETEYSLRWLPIGGFVKMLGQEDLAPDATSAHPKSYQRASIPRRMVVVSAGVVMNLILAVILFVVAFLVGVRFEAPIVAGAFEGTPAATTRPNDAERLGITEPGVRPGDLVLRAGGADVRTFADITLAVAMSKPGEPLTLEVDRPGFDDPLLFELEPVKDEISRLRSIGVGLARGPRLRSEPAVADELARLLADHPDLVAGLAPGMRIVSADGRPVRSWDEVVRAADATDGAPLVTRWRPGRGATDHDLEPSADASAPGTIELLVPVEPAYGTMIWPLAPAQSGGTPGIAVEPGLAGLVQPLTVRDFDPTSPNRDRLQPGDVITALGGRPWPNFTSLADGLSRVAGGTVAMRILRDGRPMTVTVEVSGEGRIGVFLARLESEAIVAESAPRLLTADQAGDPDTFEDARVSPGDAAGIPPGARIVAVAGTPVTGWPELRAALMEAARDAAGPGDAAGGASVTVQWAPPVDPEADPASGAAEAIRTGTLELAAEDVAALRGLGWTPVIPGALFDIPWVDLDAGGNPVTAIRMGFRETVKIVTMTYLTIDRLLRRSVGVDQLRGPVGIIDLGVQVLPRGFMYLLFLLGMISVNLAVLNFLPLPIVDGGLFLYLVYESFTGRPPPPAFQNAATLVGLMLLGTLFLVTFYNDIARLI
jgi:regulator of sigma E protease